MTTSTAGPALPPPGFRHRYPSVGGTRLHCVDGGSGEPVLLLHGFPNTWYAWRAVMPALAERFRVVAVDLRGLGDSDRPGHGYDVPHCTDDLHGLVDELGLDAVRVAGQDWGGSVGFAFTAAHPDRVRALAVLEALPAGPWPAPGPPAWFAEFHSIPALPEILVEHREGPYLAWFYRAFSATAGVPTDDAVAEYLRTYREPGAMSAAFGLYRGRPAEKVVNGAPGRLPVRTPILAVGGGEVLGAAVAANLHHAATTVHEVVLDGAGHFLTEERPDDVARLLLAFFADEPATSASPRDPVPGPP